MRVCVGCMRGNRAYCCDERRTTKRFALGFVPAMLFLCSWLIGRWSGGGERRAVEKQTVGLVGVVG